MVVTAAEIAWEGGGVPPPPDYILDICRHGGRATAKSEAKGKVQEAGRAAKKRRGAKSRAAAAFNANVREAAEGMAEQREAAGLHPCCEFNDRNVMCRHVYGTAAGLAAHAAAVACGTTAKGNAASHSFGSANARTTIVALSQQHAGMLAVGARPDR